MKRHRCPIMLYRLSCDKAGYFFLTVFELKTTTYTLYITYLCQFKKKLAF